MCRAVTKAEQTSYYAVQSRTIALWELNVAMSAYFPQVQARCAAVLFDKQRELADYINVFHK